MTIKWKALLNPRATTAEFLGIEDNRQDRKLGLRLTKDTLVRVDTGETVPLDTIIQVDVTAEPATIRGAIAIGPVGFIGQRVATFLTVVTAGPVWSLPIDRKRTAQALELAARILTAAHAARVE